MTAEPVARLAAEASAASQKLGQTMSDLRQRTNPDVLFDEAYGMAAEQGQKLVAKTRATVAAHPFAIGAAVAAIGLALLARNTLANAKVDFGDETHAYTDYDESYENRPATPVGADSSNKADAGSGNPLVSAIVGIVMGGIISLFSTKN